MATWGDLEAVDPELAAFGRARIDCQVSFLATVRGDGSPRVHPVTPWITKGGLFVRMYVTSPKGVDLRRDPRFALHSMMDNDDGVGGEFALSGRSHIITDADLAADAYGAIGGPGTDRPLVLFELGLDEVVATEYDGDVPVRRRWRDG